MSLEISFTWKDKNLTAIVTEVEINGATIYDVTVPAGPRYSFQWNANGWMDISHQSNTTLPDELKIVITTELDKLRSSNKL